MSAKLNRNEKMLQRCLSLALYFESKGTGVSPQDIYEKFYPQLAQESASTSFQRDRNLLNSAGISIGYDTTNNLYHLETDKHKTTPLALSDEERSALGVSLRTLAYEPNFPLPLTLRLALLRIEDHIHDDTPEDMLFAHMSQDDNLEEQQHSLESIIGAIRAKQCITFDYTNAKGEQTHRLVAPYVLNQFKGQWYLIGLDVNHARAMRTFLIANIENVALADEPFELPEHFNAESYCEPPHMWGADAQKAVTLLIPARCASRIDSITHGAGELAENGDGSLTWNTHYRNLDKLCEFVIAQDILFAPESRAEIEYYKNRFLERVVNAHG